MIQHISECFIKPRFSSSSSSSESSNNQPYYLSPWGLSLLSIHYTQKGLLYTKPTEANDGDHFINTLLDNLKHSLSIALLHFYPLSGRLSTIHNENEASSLIYVDCNNSPGAKFIHATLDRSISDIVSQTYDALLIVRSLFDHDRAVNHDGHTMSLLSVKVTELSDAIFIGCSTNHSLMDGNSYWHFFNMWSEIFHDQTSISRPPILQPWFLEDHGPIFKLPFTHHDQFIRRFELPSQIREKFFHFSSKSLSILKAKANAEANTNKISTFQSLSALVWRCVIRARGIPKDEITSCILAINNRSRLEPPLSENYFGNISQTVRGFTTVGELLENNIGWAAWKLHEVVINHNDGMVKDYVKKWMKSPFVYEMEQFSDPSSIMMGSSPRFNKYGNEFGMGKPLAVLSGYANKFDGKVSSYPGSEGGSIDLEFCLSFNAIDALQTDEEFMDAVSSYN